MFIKKVAANAPISISIGGGQTDAWPTTLQDRQYGVQTASGRCNVSYHGRVGLPWVQINSALLLQPQLHVSKTFHCVVLIDVACTITSESSFHHATPLFCPFHGDKGAICDSRGARLGGRPMKRCITQRRRLQAGRLSKNGCKCPTLPLISKFISISSMLSFKIDWVVWWPFTLCSALPLDLPSVSPLYLSLGHGFLVAVHQIATSEAP